MKCPKCGNDWPEGVKFCGVDGAKLAEPAGPTPGPDLDAVIVKLRSLLPQIGLGSFKELAPGVFIAQKGSTHVQVQAVSVGLGRVAIRSTSPVTVDTPITPELLEFLLNENASFLFGAFGLGPKKEILFYHSIMASSVDAMELGVSVSAVVNTADKYDDQIVTRWGGKTARQQVIGAVVATGFMKRLQDIAAEAAKVARRPRAVAVAAHRATSGTPDVSAAIKIASVAEEYAFLARQRCNCGGSYQRETQVILEIRGLHFDQIDMRCTTCGSAKTFLFDINSFFSKRS